MVADPKGSLPNFGFLPSFEWGRCSGDPKTTGLYHQEEMVGLPHRLDGAAGLDGQGGDAS
jgi:hypothetical protein